MSWKYVFNSTVGNVIWGHIDNCNKAAKVAGYKFFTWNGWVYNVDGNSTQITVDDLY